MVWRNHANYYLLSLKGVIMARTTIFQTKRGPKIVTEKEKDAPVRHQRAVATSSHGRRGQPPVYDAERFPYIAGVLCKERGFTSEELARVFGVSKKTVDYWMITHDDFKNAVRQGRFAFDTSNVEQALLKRALGYTYEERTTKSIYLREKNDAGKVVKIPAKEVSVVVKEIPPDVKACTFWLTNRQPDDWKMTINVKGEHVMTNNNNNLQIAVTADLEHMDEQQLMALREMVAQNQERTGNAPKTIEMTPIHDLLERADKMYIPDGIE